MVRPIRLVSCWTHLKRILISPCVLFVVALIQLTCGQNENTTVEAAPTTVTSEADASSTITTTLSTTTMGAAQVNQPSRNVAWTYYLLRAGAVLFFDRMCERGYSCNRRNCQNRSGLAWGSRLFVFVRIWSKYVTSAIAAEITVWSAIPSEYR